MRTEFVGVLIIGTASAVTPAHRVSRISMLAQWTAADMKRRGRSVPSEVDSLLAADFPSRDQVPIMWAALSDCYASEAEAIAAAKRYPSLVLPYMNSPGNIVGSYNVLVDLLGRETAREVCIKNPAVLGNDPYKLQLCTAKDIQDSANLREFIDTKVPGGQRLLASCFAVAAVAGIAAALTAAPASAASTASLAAVELDTTGAAPTLQTAKDVLNQLLGSPIALERMDTMDPATGELRTPISNIAITPAGWVLLAAFACSRYSRNLEDLRLWLADRVVPGGARDE